MSGAPVYNLTQSANATTLTLLATVYSDTLGTPSLNPQTTDSFGHAAAYVNDSQLYTIVWVNTLIGQIIYTVQTVGNAVSSISISQQVSTGETDGTNHTFTISVTPLLYC